MTDRRDKYEQKRTVKRVSFNVASEPDLLELANTLPDFSGWVKAQLRILQNDRNTQPKDAE
jgi:hypothetical protein